MAEEKMICHYSGLSSPVSYENKEGEEKKATPSDRDLDRIIEMAWEDRTPFDAIAFQFGLKENEVKALMKKSLNFSSYKRWRNRVENCSTKHLKTRSEEIDRFKSKAQRRITGNRISKKRY